MEDSSREPPASERAVLAKLLRGAVRLGVAAVQEVAIAGQLVAFAGLLVVVGGRLVVAGSDLVGIGKGLLGLGERLLVGRLGRQRSARLPLSRDCPRRRAVA